MSKNEKICKLFNAVKQWRGVKNGKTGKWIKMPVTKAKARVERWMGELRIPLSKIEELASMKTYGDFKVWLAENTKG
jgi:hypothetical protein